MNRFDVYGTVKEDYSTDLVPDGKYGVLHMDNNQSAQMGHMLIRRRHDRFAERSCMATGPLEVEERKYRARWKLIMLGLVRLWAATQCASTLLPESAYHWLIMPLLASLRLMFHRLCCYEGNTGAKVSIIQDTLRLKTRIYQPQVSY